MLRMSAEKTGPKVSQLCRCDISLKQDLTNPTLCSDRIHLECMGIILLSMENLVALPYVFEDGSVMSMG